MGGAEVLMSTLLPELKNKGAHVELICLNSKCAEAIQNKIQKSKIQIHFLSTSRSLYNPIHIFSLYKLLTRLKPDIIHAHIFPTLYWVALTKFFFRLKAPLIFTEHATSNTRMENKLFRLVDLFIYRNYSRLICISDGVLNAIRNHIPFIPLKTIYNGIDIKQLHENSSLCHSKDLKDLILKVKSNPANKIILSIGRLVKQKNQESIIRMMSKLPSNFYLIICGEGDCRDNLEQLINKLNIGANVFLLGNQIDISYIITQSDIGILASTKEGFGLAAAEMMALGLPVVSSNIPGLMELCPDSRLQAAPLDINKFADITNSLLADSAFYSEMKEKSIQKIQSFSIQKMAENYILEYESVLFKTS